MFPQGFFFHTVGTFGPHSVTYTWLHTHTCTHTSLLSSSQSSSYTPTDSPDAVRLFLQIYNGKIATKSLAVHFGDSHLSTISFRMRLASLLSTFLKFFMALFLACVGAAGLLLGWFPALTGPFRMGWRGLQVKTSTGAEDGSFQR